MTQTTITISPNNDYRWKWDTHLSIIPTKDQREEIVKWCEQAFGKAGRYRKWIWYLDDTLLFIDQGDAVMFLLAWG